MIKEATVRRPQRKNPDSSSGDISLYTRKHRHVITKRYWDTSSRRKIIEYWKTLTQTGYYIISPDIND